MPSVLPFHIQGFSCQLAKDRFRGEELFILVLTSVNECEDCVNHLVMSQACRWEREKILESLKGFEPMTL